MNQVENLDHIIPIIRMIELSTIKSDKIPVVFIFNTEFYREGVDGRSYKCNGVLKKFPRKVWRRIEAANPDPIEYEPAHQRHLQLLVRRNGFCASETTMSKLKLLLISDKFRARM